MSGMPEDRIRLRSAVAVFWIDVLSAIEARGQVNVTQEHNNPSRDDVDAAFTPYAAANLTQDLTFDGTISGTHPGLSRT